MDPSRSPFLTETEVLDAVENFLSQRAFVRQDRVPSVRAHGNDLVMVSPNRVTLYVEAKGQTSEQPHTRRFHEEFTRNQKEDHLGRALVKATRYVSEGRRFAIALPGDAVDVELIGARTKAFDRLGIAVLLVNPVDRVVSVRAGRLPP